MIAEIKLSDEPGRLAAVERYIAPDMPAEPFDKITRLVCDILQVPIASVSLIDRDQLHFRSIRGLDATHAERPTSFCTHTIMRDTPLIVADAQLDPLFMSNPNVIGPPFVRSYAGTPLTSPDGYHVGSLCAVDTKPREFSDDQLRILQGFAALVMNEFDLRMTAEQDHLTGAFTRRGFVDKVNAEIARCSRSHRSSGLILIDLDHFKSVNDRYGHPAGDTVLQTVVSVCSQQLRTNDLIGRIGGEEFAVLLPEVDSAGAWSAAEKLRRAVEATVFPVEGGIRLTSSFGIAMLGGQVRTAEDWMSDADKALYSAKHAGRNCCVFLGDLQRNAAA